VILLRGVAGERCETYEQRGGDEKWGFGGGVS
jgi:hypothetical protein